MKTLVETAAGLPGYTPQALSAPAAQAFLTRYVEAIADTETVGIFQALGRTLAVDVVSPLNVPPHDNSAMDGYAFQGTALSPASGPGPDGVLTLRVVGTALAGKAWTGTVGPGDCVKIMTGAILPAGLDTVVPVELTELAGPEHISLPAARLKPGANRRLCGEDLRQGAPALRRGDLLNAAALGLVASLGLASVTVFRPLRVAYFSTGDEVLSLGEPPREGAVYDSNRYTVFGLLSRLGCQVIDLGVVRDDPALLQAAFTHAAGVADAIITSGGVSVGEADYTRAMMSQLGDVAFWRIAMRPGQPMAVGRIASPACQASPDSPGASAEPEKSAVLFGLPGNPVAVMVTFLAFVRPALLQMMGRSARETPLLQARASDVIRKKPGRTEYQRGIVSTAPDGSLQVSTTGNQGSGVLSSMAQANGLIVLPHARGDVAAGEVVEVMLLDGLV